MNESSRTFPIREAEFAADAYDVERIRADFPILSSQVHGHPLCYLDNAASAQKPRAVLDAVRDAYETTYANVHRGVHYLSERATTEYEAARTKTRRFINARHDSEIVFTRGATESINLVAASFGRAFLAPGDEIIISEVEHHSNIIPWQLLRDSHGVVLKVAPISDDGEIDFECFEKLFTQRTKLVAVSHMSNALGTIQPARRIVDAARAHGAWVLFDGCQAAIHLPVDVQELDCDFYAFSSHKIYGPSGIGVLYGKAEILDAMPPYQGGGEMIKTVTFEETTWADPPARFEAGTPSIVQAIGFGAALDYVTGIGKERIQRHESDVLGYATQRLAAIDGVRLFGTAPAKASVLSFNMDCAHPHDVATVLDRSGVAVRAGHHCAQPLMKRLGVTATVRASFAMYSTRAEADALAGALQSVKEIFA